jgi:hypothetical protein
MKRSDLIKDSHRTHRIHGKRYKDNKINYFCVFLCILWVFFKKQE